jgi:hypothetical protein
MKDCDSCKWSDDHGCDACSTCKIEANGDGTNWEAGEGIEVDAEGICPACSGSGEGMHEGTTCRACKGKGEL